MINPSAVVMCDIRSSAVCVGVATDEPEAEPQFVQFLCYELLVQIKRNQNQAQKKPKTTCEATQPLSTAQTATTRHIKNGHTVRVAQANKAAFAFHFRNKYR
jgi:hypothetical protein